MAHHYQDLIQLFDKTFSNTHNTRLIKGADEPIYLPASKECSYHQIVFARGYYASAFHEIAHWCHAGAKRRLLEDYGYWYVPDGRNEQQQAKFEQAEVIPQAIEWAFNVAAKRKFHVSADNLSGFQADTERFKLRVYQQVCHFIEHGFPERAQQFIEVLSTFYHSTLPLTVELFQVDSTCHEIEYE
ncbi:elongation factor P hydroxylase [Colwellia sp. D2M02]|uniref:elongation factor P hydroxylase n=1 Tax=Colwellia sp. D2M02 TaxID=2841562 RepID=UPI001C08EA26|nr:elongation factor P hydroxylase [Colwellia sp. D2M02]MBU2892370.1 elongation factor P hydroxylase [Colwellia sp. D2M02]